MTADELRMLHQAAESDFEDAMDDTERHLSDYGYCDIWDEPWMALLAEYRALRNAYAEGLLVWKEADNA